MYNHQPTLGQSSRRAFTPHTRKARSDPVHGSIPRLRARHLSFMYNTP